MLEEALNWISFHWSPFGCHWYSRENASENLERRKGYWKRNDSFFLSSGKVLAEEVQYCYSCSWFWWRCIQITVSRLALGPTQPPIQRVPQILSPGIKQMEGEAEHLPPSGTEVMSDCTSAPPTCLQCVHGVPRDNFFFA